VFSFWAFLVVLPIHKTFGNNDCLSVLFSLSQLKKTAAALGGGQMLVVLDDALKWDALGRF